MPDMTRPARQKTSYMCSTDSINIVVVPLNCIAVSCCCVSASSLDAHVASEAILQFSRHTWRPEAETGLSTVAHPGKKTLCAADLQQKLGCRALIAEHTACCAEAISHNTNTFLVHLSGPGMLDQEKNMSKLSIRHGPFLHS